MPGLACLAQSPPKLPFVLLRLIAVDLLRNLPRRIWACTCHQPVSLSISNRPQQQPISNRSKGRPNSLFTASLSCCRQIPLSLLNHLLLPRCFAPVLGEQVLRDRVPQSTRLVAFLLRQGSYGFRYQSELVKVYQYPPFLGSATTQTHMARCTTHFFAFHPVLDFLHPASFDVCDNLIGWDLLRSGP